MRYNVDKEKFKRLLVDRPTLIKKITSLDADTAAYFIGGSKRCYEFLSFELKASVKVVKAYMKQVGDDSYNSYYNSFDYQKIPHSVLDKLSLTERKILIKAGSGYDPTYIRSFPNKSFEEWKHAVKHGFHIKEVPEQYYTEVTLYEALAEHIKDNTGIIHDNIPEKFWENAQADQHITDLIRIVPHFIKVIPPKRITKDHLIAAFQSGEINLGDEEEYRQIPSNSWDKGVVALALNKKPKNIGIIPPSLLTETDAINVAKASVHMSQIPEQVLTRKVKIHIAANHTTSYDSVGPFNSRNDADDFPELLDIDFLCDVAKEDDGKAVKNIWKFVKPEYRIRVLETSPYFIEFIPKKEQTDKMIDILLDNATSEDLDNLDTFINLGKIKKHHAPLFIGCESNLLLTTVEKKFKGAQRKMSDEEAKALKTNKTAFSVEINVAPVDFAKIKDQLDSITK